MDNRIKKAFVIGSPISHSLSPHLHNFWISQYGLNGNYEKIEVLPEHLENFLSDMHESGFVGGNITLPHKETAFQLLNNHSQTAQTLTAINTVWLENGELYSDNTDAYGFAANLDDFAPRWRQLNNAVVLGAGGAAKSVVHALIDSGYRKIFIANRTVSRADELVKQFGSWCIALDISEIGSILEQCQILINTTSLGMKGQKPLEIDLASLPQEAIVTDIVYNPLETDLLKQASGLGLMAIDGIGMLLHQAVPGFERWFGIRPEVTPELRNHVLKQLGGN